MSSTQHPKRRRLDLATGWPHPSLLSPLEIRDAANIVLSEPHLAQPALLYGKDEGDTDLRINIASWLSDFYSPQSTIAPDRICITGGASQNLACILQTYTDPLYTRNIWMVAPTYFLACRIFDDAGFASRLRAVPEDAQGIDLAFLSDQLRISEDAAQKAGNLHPQMKPPRPWRKIFKHVIYCVPSFANPSGRSMSLSRREGLVRLARQYDALLVSDDVYDMLQWPFSSPFQSHAHPKASFPRLVDIDHTIPDPDGDKFGHTISNGSFSKLIGPGCRTGWAEGTPAIAYGLSQTGSSRSGGCPSQLVATFINQFLLSGGLTAHIQTQLIPTYARRYGLMMRAIADHLGPLGVTTTSSTTESDEVGVRGGYFIFLTLPSPLSADIITVRALEEENVLVTPGPKCQVTGDPANKDSFTANLRLCFSYADEEELVEGVRRLAEVIKKEQDEQSR